MLCFFTYKIVILHWGNTFSQSREYFLVSICMLPGMLIIICVFYEREISRLFDDLVSLWALFIYAVLLKFVLGLCLCSSIVHVTFLTSKATTDLCFEHLDKYPTEHVHEIYVKLGLFWETVPILVWFLSGSRLCITSHVFWTVVILVCFLPLSCYYCLCSMHSVFIVFLSYCLLLLSWTYSAKHMVFCGRLEGLLWILITV
jgi:hypothetical protein